MKKRISLILLGLLFAGTAFSQSSVWEVSKNGHTLYLGGSAHLLRAEDYPLPSEFDTAFEKSDRLVLEVDVAQMANPEIAQQMMTQMMLPGEETLQTVLNTETYQLLEAKCAELSVPLENIMKFKPAMVATILTMVKMQQIGFEPQGVDTYYLAKASEKNLPTDFLETVDFQINALVHIGEGYENEFVKYTLDDLDNLQTDIDRLIPEWRTGTSEFINSEIAEMKEMFPTVYKSIMTDRNTDWLPKIENYLTDEPVEFIIVGLAHLQTDDGLLAALQSKGYTVTQVK